MPTEMKNKVPEVTLYFWIIKVLCTTTGETGADYLIEKFFGLVTTAYIMAAILIVLLVGQFKLRRYVPTVYWLCVVLLSVVGTLATDILTDQFGVSLVTSSSIFAIILASTFAAWYKFENSLSVHSIYTFRREAFYWLTIFVTFALGTAVGDLVAEKLQVGYFYSVGLFGSLIFLITVAYYYFSKGRSSSERMTIATTGFWLAYIFTRPFGASIGDFLSQDIEKGGLGLGTTMTSVAFLLTISGLVLYLTVTKKDVID